MAPEPEDTPTPFVHDEIETVSVRRAPKYGTFFVLGAAIGILAAMILTFAYSGSDGASPNTGIEYSQLQVFGFIVLVCVPIGLALGGAAALLLDRTVGRRTREMLVDHERVQLPD